MRMHIALSAVVSLVSLVSIFVGCSSSQTWPASIECDADSDCATGETCTDGQCAPDVTSDGNGGAAGEGGAPDDGSANSSTTTTTGGSTAGGGGAGGGGECSYCKDALADLNPDALFCDEEAELLKEDLGDCVCEQCPVDCFDKCDDAGSGEQTQECVVCAVQTFGEECSAEHRACYADDS